MKLTGMRTLAVLAAALVAALALNAATSGAAKGEKVYWISLSGEAEQAPEFVFFTANSGGQVHDLTWRKWGKRKTVGRGTFENTQPCPPACDEPGPAKIVLRKPVRCTPEFGDMKGERIRVYRRGKLRYPDGEGGENVADISDRTGWGVCKQSG